MCFRLGSAVGPSAFVRQPSPVTLRPSAFARQPSRPLFPPASPWPSAMVGGVWMVWPWLRSAFGTASGLLWDARPPAARPCRLGFLVSRLAVSVSECKVIASLLPRCAMGCAAVRTRAIMCDEMQWGWKSGLLRRETNEYVFLLSNGKVFLHVRMVSIDFSCKAEQVLRGSFTGRRGSGR